jgi:dolichyl-phosphate-mannose--protein O-mannosyl transferase
MTAPLLSAQFYIIARILYNETRLLSPKGSRSKRMVLHKVQNLKERNMITNFCVLFSILSALLSAIALRKLVEGQSGNGFRLAAAITGAILVIINIYVFFAASSRAALLQALLWAMFAAVMYSTLKRP